MGVRRHCKRCGYNWEQRVENKARQCPYCKSPRWDTAHGTKPEVKTPNSEPPGEVDTKLPPPKKAPEPILSPKFAAAV